VFNPSAAVAYDDAGGSQETKSTPAVDSSPEGEGEGGGDEDATDAAKDADDEAEAAAAHNKISIEEAKKEDEAEENRPHPERADSRNDPDVGEPGWGCTG
jgi:hypothetical protein